MALFSNMDRAPTGSTIDLEFDDSAFAQASPFRRRSYTAVFDIAVILFALLATLGIYRAITVNRSLPPPIVDYNPTVNFLLLTDQHDILLAQLQMVARLDDLNAQHALSEIVRISGKLERYETQAWAYRRMLARTRGDLRLPTLLASAILDQSTRTPAELAESSVLIDE